jgi:hypothetical protein
MKTCIWVIRAASATPNAVADWGDQHFPQEAGLAVPHNGASGEKQGEQHGHAQDAGIDERVEGQARRQPAPGEPGQASGRTSKNSTG